MNTILKNEYSVIKTNTLYIFKGIIINIYTNTLIISEQIHYWHFNEYGT